MWLLIGVSILGTIIDRKITPSPGNRPHTGVLRLPTLTRHQPVSHLPHSEQRQSTATHRLSTLTEIFSEARKIPFDKVTKQFFSCPNILLLGARFFFLCSIFFLQWEKCSCCKKNNLAARKNCYGTLSSGIFLASDKNIVSVGGFRGHVHFISMIFHIHLQSRCGVNLRRQDFPPLAFLLHRQAKDSRPHT